MHQRFQLFDEMWNFVVAYKMKHPHDMILCDDNPDAGEIGFCTSLADRRWTTPIGSYHEAFHRNGKSPYSLTFDTRLVMAAAINQGIEFNDW